MNKGPDPRPARVKDATSRTLNALAAAHAKAAAKADFRSETPTLSPMVKRAPAPPETGFGHAVIPARFKGGSASPAPHRSTVRPRRR